METIFINGFKPISNKDGEVVESLFTTEQFNFLGGEVHVKIKLNEDLKADDVTIYAHANSSDDVMSILMTNDALYRMGYTKINLFIPYMPYARQDRVMVDGEPFSLKVMTDLLKLCNFNKIYVMDAHSDITPTLLEHNIVNISNKKFVYEALTHIVGLHGYAQNDKGVSENEFKATLKGSPLFISPDSGAFKKIFKLASELHYKDELILCNKARNLADGKILAYAVDKQDLEGKDCVIIDDICSKGGTFMGLAKELKKRNAGKIYLIVSHYENSANILELKASGIEKVFTTPSIGKVEKEPNYVDFVKVIPFGEFIEFVELGIA
jgi:ribose-phosphate pyrophosphokinase